ncbi:MAG TPA: methyltransferase domain-containing protein [Vicinamibacterales bacterium]|nr:methyltransferase domain-containing protein [Vicinamibacterales bacterium]
MHSPSSSTPRAPAPDGKKGSAIAGGPSAYQVEGFSYAEFPAGARVLDIGFGWGEQMREVERRGGRAFGLEFDVPQALRGRGFGLSVCRGSAERLPFATASLDGVICKVVLMYTDEARSLAEIARVLRPGGTARVSYHGLGYPLKDVCSARAWKRRVYGARTIVNTAVYRATGRRLPRFWGDTLFQTSPRLRRYYRTVGLELVSEHLSRRFGGSPVYICHVLRKRA